MRCRRKWSESSTSIWPRWTNQRGMDLATGGRKLNANVKMTRLNPGVRGMQWNANWILRALGFATAAVSSAAAAPLSVPE